MGVSKRLVKHRGGSLGASDTHTLQCIEPTAFQPIIDDGFPETKIPISAALFEKISRAYENAGATFEEFKNVDRKRDFNVG